MFVTDCHSSPSQHLLTQYPQGNCSYTCTCTSTSNSELLILSLRHTQQYTDIIFYFPVLMYIDTLFDNRYIIISNIYIINIFVFDREKLDLLDLAAQLDLRELEESPVPMVLLAPLVPL